MRNSPRNFRCSICNRVTNEDLANNPDEFKAGLWYEEDPHDPTKWNCNECLDVIEECNAEF